MSKKTFPDLQNSTRVQSNINVASLPCVHYRTLVIPELASMLRGQYG